LFVRFQHFVKRRIGIEDAEDLAQEACLTILQKYKTETFKIGFEAWAYGVLKMKIGNYIQGPLKKQKRLVAEPETRTFMKSEPRASLSDLKRQLLGCLKKIIKVNPTYARALNFVHQGFKTGEICRKLGVTTNHFYVILKRGRHMLETCLKTGRVE
jgi:RNA polymerase sigma factor (sigma-70 family)